MIAYDIAKSLMRAHMIYNIFHCIFAWKLKAVTFDNKINCLPNWSLKAFVSNLWSLLKEDKIRYENFWVLMYIFYVEYFMFMSIFVPYISFLIFRIFLITLIYRFSNFWTKTINPFLIIWFIICININPKSGPALHF